MVIRSLAAVGDNDEATRESLLTMSLPRLSMGATRFPGVVHVVHWRSGAPVHHTVHCKFRTYQIAITRYFGLGRPSPVFQAGACCAPPVHQGARTAPIVVTKLSPPSCARMVWETVRSVTVPLPL
jgi:hypothetical protein